MFREILQEVVEESEGGIAGLVMGFDGITVDQYSRGGGPVDIESVGLEYSVSLKSILAAAQMLNAGATTEISIKTERFVTLIRPLQDDYFVALILSPDGNIGKARFLLRTRSAQLADQFN